MDPQATVSRYSVVKGITPILLFLTPPVLASDWPQWRGPDRSNVSKETGLLKEWPPGGPPLAWQASGLGDGVAPVSVVAGRVFTTGSEGGDAICTAHAEADGKRLWSSKLGPAAKEASTMRWLSQTAPTVDGDRLFAVTANGDYVCLEANSGKEIWRKHFVTDFDGSKGTWGFCDYPLIDGDNLILTPGGSKATIVAVNKRTGDTVWTCPLPGGESSGHATPVLAQIGGISQYVSHLATRMVGVSATDGKLLWVYQKLPAGVAVTHAPVVRGDTVFYASGYSVGHVLLKITKEGDVWTATEVYRGKNNKYLAWLGSPTAMGDHVVLNTQRGMLLLERNTGTIAWENEKVGRCMYTVADGRLFIRDQKGTIFLASADPKEYRELARFVSPQSDKSKGHPAWTFPVVANGHLYIRDYDTLFRYDVREPATPKKKNPDAVFVPTPMDVVAKMLDLAKVKKEDVVYDLGSGDGRVVIEAARKHGCKAVGVEIDEALVTISRTRARESGVDGLVRFEHADLFSIDFSDATVVALYILPEMTQRLAPRLDKLKPGARVVTHNFPIPGVQSDRIVKVTSEEDDIERPLYLYTAPLRKEKSGGR